ncbi:MAG: PqqD family protein [Prevotella sp.]|nr:PqqD family protein [Prevotella sp.]
MRTKKGFKLRQVCGENIIVAEGLVNIDFGHLIVLNESAAYLWNKACKQDFSIEDLTQWLLDEYEVDEDTARADAQQQADSWLQAGIAEP